MKARVKATGEIVELNPYDEVYEKQKEPFKSKKHKICHLEGIEILDGPDYWTRLEHQYAGMAMQGILSNIDLLMSLAKQKADDYPAKYTVAEFAKDCAHALVQELKEKEERK